MVNRDRVSVHKVLDMIMEGHSFESIAKALGRPSRSPYKAVLRVARQKGFETISGLMIAYATQKREAQPEVAREVCARWRTGLGYLSVAERKHLELAMPLLASAECCNLSLKEFAQRPDIPNYKTLVHAMVRIFDELGIDAGGRMVHYRLPLIGLYVLAGRNVSDSESSNS